MDNNITPSAQENHSTPPLKSINTAENHPPASSEQVENDTICDFCQNLENLLN